jgi:hypothetical protein
MGENSADCLDKKKREREAKKRKEGSVYFCNITSTTLALTSPADFHAFTFHPRTLFPLTFRTEPLTIQTVYSQFSMTISLVIFNDASLSFHFHNSRADANAEVS